MNKEKKPVIIGIGELLWDMLPDGKRAGGAPANLIYHAAQQGAEGYVISAVGNDDAGQELTRLLDKNGIGHCLSRIEKPTGLVEVTLKEGIPAYTIIQEVAWDYIPLTQEAVEQVCKADAVCFGTLAQRSPVSGETIRALLKQSRPDALRFFDINLRQSYYSKEIIEASLQESNILKINDEELEVIRPLLYLSGENDDACRSLLKTYGLTYLILTAGSRYSTVYTANDISTIATPSVTVVDTVGAGDAFSGTFLRAILTGKTFREAHQAAVETAAYVCTKSGAWPAYVLPFGS